MAKPAPPPASADDLAAVVAAVRRLIGTYYPRCDAAALVLDVGLDGLPPVTVPLVGAVPEFAGLPAFEFKPSAFRRTTT